ncbi:MULTISPECIES: DUF4386 family protein [Myxococcus]|uniref:DUF4386 family protein n=1 Tax=Myxococcus xanthus TaxID=34 RepID=A0AAE6KSL9_MYXXA|nr:MULTISPECIES: DUF4386 family protein [Myxococcus]QDE68334.1 hypothetical protein BHS09_15855 [Myxococcus xanthus]QDE75611.1 hypothetical protein BHS08_15870 [Myxococcus xanthus]QDE82938.1 hypothetical protein BHS07_16030 [Myxococcus xanthus]WAM29667.1 DUF4386 family protein [Myxococcus sp. NMCA1]
MYKTSTVYRFGGICGVLTGLLYIVIAGSMVVDPGASKATATTTTPEYWQGLASNLTPFIVRQVAYILSGFTGVGFVVALSTFVRRDENAGWVNWGAILGASAYVITGVDGSRLLATLPHLAQQWATGDAATRQMVEFTYSVSRLDPGTYMRFGALGLWTLTVALASLKSGILSKPLTGLTFVATTGYVLVVVGIAGRIMVLQELGAVIAGILVAPIWFIWSGIAIRRASA